MKSKNQDKGIVGGKKLKDFPSVPDTPPPEPKKDKEVVRLERELDRERVYLSVLQKENKEIEKILLDLEREINYVKNNFPQNLDGDGKIHADNEYWFKYEAQMEVNRKLERERRHLESEIKQMEEQGMINLDSLTQSELILYVKQLERTKTDLLSDLRAKEWSLDKQAKDYHHLNETKRALEAEIKHYDGEHALFHHYKRISCPSAGRQKSSAQRPGRGRNVGRLPGGKMSSVSHENLAPSPAPSDMFRSLDESKLKDLKTSSPVPSHQRRLAKEVSKDDRKKPERGKVAASLPELSEKRSKTPPAVKTVRTKSEHAVGRSRSSPSTTRPSSSIKIIVTDESDELARSETPTTTSWKESGIGSPSDYADDYEDDFEESDGDTAKEIRSLDEKPKEPIEPLREETFRKAEGEDGFKVITTEPINGSKFTITIRIMGRIVSKPSAKCTINAVEATVNPR